jgi:hypothetical protein
MRQLHQTTDAVPELLACEENEGLLSAERYARFPPLCWEGVRISPIEATVMGI